jgi:hypothetical protein
MLARWLAVGLLGFMIGAATIVLADSNDDTRTIVAPVAATGSDVGLSSAAHAGHTTGGPVVENGKVITGVKAQDIAAESQPDVPLDVATREILASQLVAARNAALSLPTVADALAAGFVLAGGFAPGSGAHYVGVTGRGLTGTGGVDAGTPDTYIYDGTAPDSRVVGLMYNSLSQVAPEGFAGPNDHWHRHSNVCIKYSPNGIEVPFPADSDVTAQQCSSKGGRLMTITTWMVHAWVVPGWESPEGVFSHNNSNLRCGDGTLNTDEVGFCAGT